MNQRRKLAAILFTDIVGYTQQSNDDEVQSLRARGSVDRMVRDAAASHNGTVIKSIGDALMIEFSSAVDAVTCAISIQERMADIRTESPGEPPIQMRVGVHVGDVVEEDGDLFGNAVNIAQRIQGMAEPDGICISREVYTQIRPILKLRCDVVTTPPKKPLPEPIEVLSVTSEALDSSGATTRGSDQLLPWLIPACLLAFPAAWWLTMSLWPVREWGWVISGAALTLVLWPLLRKIGSSLPHLRPEPSQTAKSSRALIGSFAAVLVMFILGNGCASGAYMQALEEESLRGWAWDATPWDFAERNKGQEYRLLNELTSFRSNPPQVSIDAAGPMLWNSSDRNPGPAILLNAVGGCVWFLCGVITVLSAGRSSASWTRDKLAACELSNASIAITFGLLASLTLIWLFRDWIFATNGRQLRGSPVKISVAAPLKSATARLDAWCKSKGFVEEAFQTYSLKTVPKEEQVGGAAAYRLCKSNIRDRWGYSLVGWQQKAPFLYVEFVASDHPAQTVVRIDTSMSPDNSETKAEFKRDVDSLEAALKSPPKPQ